MTVLTDGQQQLLDSVREVYQGITPVIVRMETDYEQALYRAKKPVRDAIDLALDNGVPMARIVNEATDLGYPLKLKQWLAAPESLADPDDVEDVPEQAVEIYAEDIESIRTVTRDPRNGEFLVVFQGMDFKVPAMGPDSEPWAVADSEIPQGVYDLVTEKYPGFVVLGEDDD